MSKNAATYSDVSVVIPAFNEKDGITETVSGLKAILTGAEIIIVDDGSNDGTAEIASKIADVRLVRHEFNRGYGAALKTGMEMATRPIIAWFDADNEHRPTDLSAMVDLLTRERLVAVIGRRRKPGVTVFRATRKLVIVWVARLLGLNVGRDLNCGLRVFRASAILPYLSILPDTFSASTTSTMILAERRYSVTFYDIDTNQRMGQSKIRIRDGFGALTIVLRTIMLFAPLRIFLGIGIPLTLVGMTYSFIVALVLGDGLPAAGIFAALAGLLFFCVGLLADQLSQMRLVALAQIRAKLATDQHSAKNSQDEH